VSEARGANAVTTKAVRVKPMVALSLKLNITAGEEAEDAKLFRLKHRL
jgi:hypothetical protein